MTIAVDLQMLRDRGEQLMELSSQLRRMHSQLDAINDSLRWNDSLQGCRRALDIELQNLSLEMSRLAALSGALQQTAELYRRCEIQNTDTLEAVRPAEHGPYAADWEPVDPDIFAALQ